MRPSLLLRIAAILTLLLAVGHTLGGPRFWSPPGETDVLRAMRSFHFDAGGSSRSYLDFFLGFGYTLSVYLILQAIAFWQLAAMANADAPSVRPLIGSFLLASIACTVLSWKFIFIVPMVSNALITVFLGLAFGAAGRGRAA